MKDIVNIIEGLDGTGTMANPGTKGLFGANSNLATVGKDGELVQNWANRQPYVRGNVYAILLRAPGGFDAMAEPELMKSILKSLIEESSKIQGLVNTINVESAGYNVHGGNEELKNVTNVNMDKSNIVHTVQELEGKAYYNFIRIYIENLLGNPINKVAEIAKQPGWNKGDTLSALMKTFSTLYVELDVTNTRVIDAWMATNQYFTTTGASEAGTDITAAKETVELSLPLEGVVISNAKVKQLAQKIFNKISNIDKLENAMPVFEDDISADIAAIETANV